VAPKEHAAFAFTAVFSRPALVNLGEERAVKVTVHKASKALVEQADRDGHLASTVELIYPPLAHFIEVTDRTQTLLSPSR